MYRNKKILRLNPIRLFPLKRKEHTFMLTLFCLEKIYLKGFKYVLKSINVELSRVRYHLFKVWLFVENGLWF